MIGKSTQQRREIMLNARGTKDRNREILRRVKSGETMAAVGADYGISRQRVEQIIRFTASSARGDLFRAVKDGTVERPDSCQVCGHAGDVEAHHGDYNKALSVVWACCICHPTLDRQRAISRVRHGVGGEEVFDAAEAADRARVSVRTLRSWVASGRLKSIRAMGRVVFLPRDVDAAVSAEPAEAQRCPKGHEFTPENTRWSYGRRQCRACGSNAVREFTARRERVRDSSYLVRTALTKAGFTITRHGGLGIYLSNGLRVSAGKDSPWIIRDGDREVGRHRRALQVIKLIREYLAAERKSAA